VKNPVLSLFILVIEPSIDLKVILIMNFYESINKHVKEHKSLIHDWRTFYEQTREETICYKMKNRLDSKAKKNS